MSHYARVNKDGIVVQVIVADQEFIDTGAVGDPNDWYKTSYNTYGNKHPEKKPFRKNYASVGFTYDKVRDAFIEAPMGQLETTLKLNERTGLWDPHTPETYEYKWVWNKALHTWEKFIKSA